MEQKLNDFCMLTGRISAVIFIVAIFHCYFTRKPFDYWCLCTSRKVVITNNIFPTVTFSSYYFSELLYFAWADQRVQQLYNCHNVLSKTVVR